MRKRVGSRAAMVDCFGGRVVLGKKDVAVLCVGCIKYVCDDDVERVRVCAVEAQLAGRFWK